MKSSIKTAYTLGYACAMQKAAQMYASDYTQPQDLGRMAVGTLGGAGIGALIGGKYRRGAGMLGGALLGAFASNPQFFLSLVNKATHGLSNVASGFSGR